MTKLKVYYAHCLAIYNTPQEARDILQLERMSFEVINPNQQWIADEVKRLKEKEDPNYMLFFRHLVVAQDVFAFRALPDGAIPAGIAKEMEYAREANKPVLELPSAVSRRTITLEQTREFLAEVGQR